MTVNIVFSHDKEQKEVLSTGKVMTDSWSDENGRSTVLFVRQHKSITSFTTCIDY